MCEFNKDKFQSNIRLIDDYLIELKKLENHEDKKELAKDFYEYIQGQLREILKSFLGGTHFDSDQETTTTSFYTKKIDNLAKYLASGNIQDQLYAGDLYTKITKLLNEIENDLPK